MLSLTMIMDLGINNPVEEGLLKYPQGSKPYLILFRAAKKSPAQVFHHKRKQRKIGHIIEPLFYQETKCNLVTSQVKNHV